MIEKVLVYGNNVLEIYRKPEFVKYYEHIKEEEIVNFYEDFLRMWQEEYPDEVNWFHLVTLERDEYRAIYLGRELTYQSRVFEKHEVYEYGLKELFVWMESAVKNCVEELRNGTYNSDVKNNLAFRQGTGTISRKDYWELFLDIKESYLADISDEEIQLFIRNIEEQKNGELVGSYLTDMQQESFMNTVSSDIRQISMKIWKGLLQKNSIIKKLTEGMRDWQN